MASASYRRCQGHRGACQADCDFLGRNPAEPCWGEVNVYAADYDGEDEYERHACEGHSEARAGLNGYRPETSAVPPSSRDKPDT